MNTVVTSRKEILSTGRALVKEHGPSAINIRSVAAACGVSVGSIYNYFGSKTELVGDIVESIWYDIFHCPEEKKSCRDIQQYITWLYQRLEYGDREYPGFFTLHAMGFADLEKTDGRQRMEQTWTHMIRGICMLLSHDPHIRPDAFNDHFTAEQLAQTIFAMVLAGIFLKERDPSPVMEMVRRAVY